MKEFLKIWLPILLVVIGAFYLTSKFIKPVPDKVLTIATGRAGGSYHEYALRYKKLLQEQDIKVNIINTAGSVEILELLNAKKADIGFVQGGTITKDDYSNLESIASIYFEPLWIFTKGLKQDVQYIKELQNLKISIGENGSGTNALIKQMANATNFNIENNTSIKYLGLADSYKAITNGEIDAFFTVVSASSPIILNLLKDESLKTVSLKRTKAYEQNFSYLSEYTVYEGSIDLINNLPKKDIHLLATTASLAVNKDVDATLIRLFTKIVKKENRRVNGFPSLNQLELPINQQAKQYLTKGNTILEKIFPYWIAVNIDRLKIMLIPLLTLMIPIFKGFLPLYRWRIRSKIYKWYKVLDVHEQRWEEYSIVELDEAIKDIQELKREIKEQIDVPLSYMNEYYMLKTHVDFVLKNIIHKKSIIST